MNQKLAAAVAVIGGDLRSLAAARCLAAAGFEIRLYGFGAPFGGRAGDSPSPVDARCCSDSPSPIDRERADLDRDELRQWMVPEFAGLLDGCRAVLLALPASSDGCRIAMPFDDGSHTLRIEELLTEMKRAGTGLLLGGKMAPAWYPLAEAYGIDLFDYYEREEFAVANAVPTAEGALAIALEKMPVTLDGASAVVIGYGRIGKLLARRLKVLGAKVTASARKEADLAWIRADGMEAIRTGELGAWLDGHTPSVIFNTVPHTVLGRAELEKLPTSVLLIDLASKPGGVDAGAVRDYGHSVIWALSLPGKTAPLTAGRIIADTVLPVLVRRDGHSSGGD